MSRFANEIEAILYLKAQPLKIAQIAEFAKCDRDTAEEGLIELMGEYSHRDGALEIAETEDGYALQLREVYRPLVDTIVPLDIGLGALRTLAAIALRGPIAQSELVDIRGSGVYQHVPDLVDKGFVKKRRQSDGRSSWLQVTEKFYQHFEIDKLPQIENLRLPKPIDGGAEGSAAVAPAQEGDPVDGTRNEGADTPADSNPTDPKEADAQEMDPAEAKGSGTDASSGGKADAASGQPAENAEAAATQNAALPKLGSGEAASNDRKDLPETDAENSSTDLGASNEGELPAPALEKDVDQAAPASDAVLDDMAAEKLADSSIDL